MHGTGDERGSETGTPRLGFTPPVLGATLVGQIGAPALVFTPPQDRAEPTYYIYPVGEVVDMTPDGPVTRILEVEPGPEYVRVAPHPVRGNNPNVFIRRDDPFAAMAEVIP